MSEEILWVEKYRPNIVEDVILSEHIKDIFRGFVNKGEIPNLILSGSSGLGKTSVTLALCKQLDYDTLLINGSIEGRNIDTVRTTITRFASTVSLLNKRKVVIIDEADFMNAESVQPALRGFIEKFHDNCRFIFTCNFKNKIIEAIHSRCKVVDFAIKSDEKPILATTFHKRMTGILKEEGIKFSPKVVASLISKHFPDFRRTINELQTYSASGEIDEGILVQLAEVQMHDLYDALKNKDFEKMRKWVGENCQSDPIAIYRKLYDGLREKFDKNSIPQAVLIIADYQYKSAFVVDQEINLVACLTELMAECEFN